MNMNKSLPSLVFFFLLLLVLVGCAATLKDYEPASSDEEAIKTVLMTYEMAWNRRDVPGVLSLLYDHGKFMTGRDLRIVSKKEYAKILPERMAQIPSMTQGIPRISIIEDNAVVSVLVDFQKFETRFFYQLIKENNKWFIMSCDY
jgi:hypothetical protein